MKFLDETNGIKNYFSHEDGKNIIKSVQDCEPIVQINRQQSQQLDKKENFWYVGTIPNVICEQWANECGARIYSKTWQEYARKQLNLPEYRAFNQNKIKI